MRVARRCVRCSQATGVLPGGRFVPYTFHPYVLSFGGSEHEAIAVFCADCFDLLGCDATRSAVAVCVVTAGSTGQRDVARA